MSLLSEATLWVFLSAATFESEDRHIFDIAYGVKCLEEKGVQSTDISIFIDGTDRKKIEQLMQHGSSHPHPISTSGVLFDFFKKVNSYNNIVLFIGGHGSLNGIDAQAPIKPYPLFSAIKSIPNLKQGIIILGQCYAGIFNFMDVSDKWAKDESGKMIEPPLVVIGATNLFQSISASCSGVFKTGILHWSSNIFLTKMFEWFNNPIDIDGDKKFTIMDAYKCAGLISNDINKFIKSKDFWAPNQILNEIEDLEGSTKTHPTKDISDPTYKILLDEIADKQKQYNNMMSIRFNHQEPWILNANLARKIEFS